MGETNGEPYATKNDWRPGGRLLAAYCIGLCWMPIASRAGAVYAQLTSPANPLQRSFFFRPIREAPRLVALDECNVTKEASRPYLEWMSASASAAPDVDGVLVRRSLSITVWCG